MNSPLKYILVSVIIGWFLGAASCLVGMHVWRGGGWHGRHGGRMHERFYKDLNLTPQQRTQVDAIFKAGHDKFDRIMSDTRSKMQEARDSTKTQIRQLLTPDQQAKFDTLSAKWDARFKKHLENFGSR